MDQGTSTQDRRDGEIDIGPWEYAWAERRGICETGRAIHRFRGTRAKIEKIERQRGTRWWDRAIATLAFFFLQGRTGWKKVMASEIAKLGMPEDKLSCFTEGKELLGCTQQTEAWNFQDACVNIHFFRLCKRFKIPITCRPPAHWSVDVSQHVSRNLADGTVTLMQSSAPFNYLLCRKWVMQEYFMQQGWFNVDISQLTEKIDVLAPYQPKEWSKKKQEGTVERATQPAKRQRASRRSAAAVVVSNSRAGCKMASNGMNVADLGVIQYAMVLSLDAGLFENSPLSMPLPDAMSMNRILSVALDADFDAIYHQLKREDSDARGDVAADSESGDAAVEDSD